MLATSPRKSLLITTLGLSVLLTGCEGVPMPGDILNAGIESVMGGNTSTNTSALWPSDLDGKPLSDLPAALVTDSYSCFTLQNNAGKQAATSAVAEQQIPSMLNSCRQDLAQYQQAQADATKERERQVVRQRKAAEQERVETARMEKETQEQNARITKERAAVEAKLPRGYAIDWDKNISTTVRQLQGSTLNFNAVKKRYQVATNSLYRVRQVTDNWIIFESPFEGALPLMMKRPSGEMILVGADITQVAGYFEIVGTKEYPTVIGGTRQALLVEPW